MKLLRSYVGIVVLLRCRPSRLQIVMQLQCQQVLKESPVSSSLSCEVTAHPLRIVISALFPDEHHQRAITLSDILQRVGSFGPRFLKVAH